MTLRAGQDMVAARAARYRNARTRRIVGLLGTAPPLAEAQRYAIAQALAECARLEVPDMGGAPRTQSTGGAMSLAEDGREHSASDHVEAAWDAYQAALEAAGMLPAPYHPLTGKAHR